MAVILYQTGKKFVDLGQAYISMRRMDNNDDDDDIRRLIRPIFLRNLEKTKGRLLISQIRSDCLSSLPQFSEAEIEASLDQIAIDFLMKEASDYQVSRR